MTSMAKYLLTGIDNLQWKRFKASCDIQGITIKQSFLSHINHEVADYLSHPEKTQGWRTKPQKGGKKK